jgi:heme A synthase
LIGAVITGLLVTFIISKKEKMEMDQLLKIILPPFYFSTAIGIWMGNFDRLLNISSNLRNNPAMVLLVSAVFLAGLILELTLLNEKKYKKFRWPVLIIIMFLYNII